MIMCFVFVAICCYFIEVIGGWMLYSFTAVLCVVDSYCLAILHLQESPVSIPVETIMEALTVLIGTELIRYFL